MQIPFSFYWKKFVVWWVLMGVFILSLLPIKETWAEDWVLDTTTLVEAAQQKIDEAERMRAEVIEGLVQYFEAGYTKEYLLSNTEPHMKDEIEEAERIFKDR